MRAEKSKKALIAFLIVNLIGMFSGIAVAKKVTPDSVMQDSLGNSLMYAEFPDGSEVVPLETDEDKADKIIQGGVTTTIDITLANCIRLALGNNPRIRAAMNDVLASHTRIAQMWSNYFPQITWTSQQSKIRQLELEDAFSEILVYNYYLLGQIGLYQMLYDFGVTQNQVTIKKLSYEQYKKTLTAVINDVIYKTKDSYFNLLYAYDQQRVAQLGVDRYTKIYNQAKAFYEIGMNPKVDVTIAEVNLSSAKLKLIQADNAIDLAVARLNRDMGVPYFNRYNVKEKLEYHPLKITLDDSLQIARDSRPELKVAELKIEEARQTVKLAKKAYNPTLSFQANYARGGSSWNSNYGYLYGVYLNFPTMNVLLNQKQIQEAKFLYEREISNAQQTKNEIYYEIQDAYLKLDEKRNQIPVSFLQVKHAGENFELSFGRYRVGEANAIELKEAQGAYSDALLTYYKTLYEFNSAKALLEKSIGKNIIHVGD